MANPELYYRQADNQLLLTAQAAGSLFNRSKYLGALLPDQGVEIGPAEPPYMACIIANPNIINRIIQVFGPDLQIVK